MKRLVDQELKKWKQSKSRKSLLLRGARQVGKTFAVRTLGQSYHDFFEVNLEKKPELHTIFEKDLDPFRILRDLSLVRGAPIEPGKTLLFIDEIQACPSALTSLRYFYEEIPQLHVIGAGSLLEFAIEQIGIPVGRVQTLTVYPMSFAEFLMAKGEVMLLEAICSKTPFSNPIHEKALTLLSEYFVVGGLPEIVSSWTIEADLLEIKDKLSTIITSYRQDFEKYAKKSQLKYLYLLLDHVPIQLGKKFKFQGIGEYRKRELAPCLDLMEKAHIIHKVYHSAGQGLPLGAQANLDMYKVIMFDIAIAQQLMGLDLKDWFLKPKESFVNQGEIVESFIGQELMAYGASNMRGPLYYWHREVRASEAEIDYLTVIAGEVIPIEVKSGRGSTLRSLHAFLEQHPKSSYGMKVSILERSQHNNIISIPLYAAFELVEGGVEKVKELIT